MTDLSALIDRLAEVRAIKRDALADLSACMREEADIKEQLAELGLELDEGES